MGQISHLLQFATASLLLVLPLAQGNSIQQTKLASAENSDYPAPYSRFLVRKIASADQVWVHRSDRSISCENGSGESLLKTSLELKKLGIKFFDKKKTHDTKMRIAMCGASTNNQNSYLINKSDLDKAKSIGFSDSAQ